jgi:GT2 family glycosyltransferase/glycosyltransferase involved in cell wall biosynthesis
LARRLDTARVAKTIVRVLQQTAPQRDDRAQRAVSRALRQIVTAEVAQGLASLDYAQRVSPSDAGIAFALGLVRMVVGDPRASESLALVVDRNDGGLESVVFLALARGMVGDVASAAETLGAGLARNAPSKDALFLDVAERLAAETRRPGWCGLRGDGCLWIGGPAAGWRARDVEIIADGRPVAAIAAAPAATGLRCARLPDAWRRLGRLEVRARGHALLGSPIDAERIGRVEGFVQGGETGGIEGWCWLPADPEVVPTVTISALTRRGRTMTVSPGDDFPDLRRFPLSARPRAFAFAAMELPADDVPLRVTGPGGGQLYGSPLRPGEPARSARAAARDVAWLYGGGGGGGGPPDAGPRAREPSIPLAKLPPAVRPAPARAPRAPRRAVAVVVPVYRGLRTTLACLGSVLRARALDERVIVVSDASPEPDLVDALRAMAVRGEIELSLQTTNRGFPGTANVGLRLADGCDVVLLNSDTLVPPDWLAGLRGAAYARQDIGSATPLSNDATIFSYPLADTANPAPDQADVDRLARLARRCADGGLVEVPTAHGFCMFIRADCLAQTGLLRDDVFAQGYGEENDFCLRARALGWRHVTAPGVYVGHVGSQSFSATRSFLIERNLRILNRLHPGYDGLVQAWLAADPLAAQRRRMDAARFAEDGGARRAVALVTHDRGGGVLRHVRARAAAHLAAGDRAILLRPSRRDGRGVCTVGTEDGESYPNLAFDLPAEGGALLDLLRGAGVRLVELHHFIGHDPSLFDLLRALSCPIDVTIHDYAWFCPRITLVTGGDRYCGEPPVTVCADCIADHGARIDEAIAPAELVRRSAAWLSAARSVIAPSFDTARRIERHFGISAHLGVWEAEPPRPTPPVSPPVSPPVAPAVAPARLVCVPGAISIEKGYNVVLALARHVARAALPLQLVVVGYSCDDERLLETGRVRITGPYEPERAVDMLRAQAADMAFLPSIWPETWSYALSEAWQAGLPVVAFDIGAPAERIRMRGGGLLLPLHTPIPRLAEALLALPAPGAR